MSIPSGEYTAIEDGIQTTIDEGAAIRKMLAKHSGKGPYNAAWEVEAAVEALQVFASRWTIEILATLYITGPRRFNEMKNMLTGIFEQNALGQTPLPDRRRIGAPCGHRRSSGQGQLRTQCPRLNLRTPALTAGGSPENGRRLGCSSLSLNPHLLNRPPGSQIQGRQHTLLFWPVIEAGVEAESGWTTILQDHFALPWLAPVGHGATG